MAALLGKRVVKLIDLTLDNNDDDDDNASPLPRLYNNRRVNRQNNNAFPITSMQMYSSASDYLQNGLAPKRVKLINAYYTANSA